jgi:hypothetical protein
MARSPLLVGVALSLIQLSVAYQTDVLRSTTNPTNPWFELPYVRAGDTVSLTNYNATSNETPSSASWMPSFYNNIVTLKCAPEKFILFKDQPYGNVPSGVEQMTTTVAGLNTKLDTGNVVANTTGQFKVEGTHYCTLRFEILDWSATTYGPFQALGYYQLTLKGPVSPPAPAPLATRIWTYAGCYAKRQSFTHCVGGRNITTSVGNGTNSNMGSCAQLTGYAYCAEMADKYGFNTFALAGACFMCNDCSLGASAGAGGCAIPVSECFGSCGNSSMHYAYKGALPPPRPPPPRPPRPLPPSPPPPRPPRPLPPSPPNVAMIVGISAGVVGGVLVVGGVALGVYFGVMRKGGTKAAKTGTRSAPKYASRIEL